MVSQKWITFFFLILFFTNSKNSFAQSKNGIESIPEGLGNCRSFIEDNIKEVWVKPSENKKEKQFMISRPEGSTNFSFKASLPDSGSCPECGEYSYLNNDSKRIISIYEDQGKFNLTSRRNYGEIRREYTELDTINFQGRCFPSFLYESYNNGIFYDEFDLKRCAKLSKLPNTLKQKVKDCQKPVKELNELINPDDTEKSEIKLLNMIYKCEEYETKYQINLVYDHILNEENKRHEILDHNKGNGKKE